MKNNLRDKQPPPSSQQNRLNKTQQPPQAKGEYLDNTYHVQKKPTMYEKPVSEKPSYPPRAGSTQKINYKVEQNMTNSKIQEAKHGLQLLKKKMVRNGMSREKNDRPTSVQKPSENTFNMKKAPSKQEEYYGYDNQVKKPTPKVNQKNSLDQPPKKTPPVPSKSIEDSRPVRRPPQNDQYFNPNEEKPLNSNQDFMAILQRQMAKEQSKGQSQPISKAYKQPAMMPAQDQQIELVECSMGCGRQFNVNTIAKHEKVCLKVFQSKRKVFNTAAQRQPDVEGDFKIPPPPPPQRDEKPKNTKQKPKEEKIPKWKQQSAAFRAGLKAGRGQQLTAEQKAQAEEASGMIQCPTCGRKFNETAGKRHIAFCESKAKQMPKMNTTVKKR